MQYVQKIAPGPIEFFAHIDVVAMALIAAIGILIAFVILAVEIVVTIIEFHIVTLVAFVTVPFGVLTQTSFMSERAIGYVVSVGIKLMALAIVVCLGTTVFDTYTVSADPGISEDVGLLLAAVVMVMLALKIPAIAGGADLRRPAAERRRRRDGRGRGRRRRRRGWSGHARAGRRGRVRMGGGRRPGRRRAQRRRGHSIGRRPSPPSAPSGGGGQMAADVARAPVSTAVSGLRQLSGRMFGAAAPEAGEDGEAPPAPTPADTVARAEARGGGLATAAQTAAATATQAEDGGPGMAANPIRPDEPDPSGPGA